MKVVPTIATSIGWVTDSFSDMDHPLKINAAQLNPTTNNVPRITVMTSQRTNPFLFFIDREASSLKITCHQVPSPESENSLHNFTSCQRGDSGVTPLSAATTRPL